MPKNIVYLSGMKVFPALTGGHLHAATIARSLARLGHQVRICSLAGRSKDYGFFKRWQVDEIEPGLTEETYLGLGVGLLQTIFRRLGYPRFWQYDLIARGHLPARMRRMVEEADLVLADFPYTPPPVWVDKNQPWFLVSHNLEHSLLEQGSARDRVYVERMRAIEAAAPQRYHDIFACAEEDQSFFRAHDASGRLQIPIIRSGVDSKVYQLPVAIRQRVRAELQLDDEDRLLVFSGSRSWQNLDVLAGLKDFCNRQQAFLERHRIMVLLLGSMEPLPFRQGRMIATGPVPETAPYFAAADAGLNPVTKGSGANVKLFEYLAALLPVISTPFGVRGSALQAGRDFIALEADDLLAALEKWVSLKTAAEWRTFAEEVWRRHRQTIDIEALVREAIAGLPAFHDEAL